MALVTIGDMILTEATGGVTPSVCSAIASSYAESAASGKQDSLAFAYDADNAISSINGSALAGGGGGVVTATASGEYYDYRPGWLGYYTGIGGVNNSSLIADFATVTNYARYDSRTRELSSLASEEYVNSSISGKQDSSAMSAYALSADVSGCIDTVSANSASWGGGATGDYVEKSATILTIGSNNTALYEGAAIGTNNSASDEAFAHGSNNRSYHYSLSQGYYNTASSNAFALGNLCFAESNSIAVGMRCSARGTSFAQGYYVSSRDTAFVFGKYNLKGNGGLAGNSAAFAIGDGTANNARHDLMLVTKDGEITMYSSTADTTGTGVMSSIRALSADVSGCIDTVSANSATWASASAISSYALSSDVSGIVDTVSSQSANWGGSALALSAGPGVRLYKTDDTLVAGLDETVLWSGNTANITGITLNETYGNFDRVRFYWKPWSDEVAWRVTEIPSFASVFTLDAGWASNAGTGKALFVYSISSNGTAFAQLQGGYQNITGSNTWASSTQCNVVKVVGVNRTAGV